MTLGAYQLMKNDIHYGTILTNATEQDIKNALKAVKVLSDLYVDIDIREQLVKILIGLGFKAEISIIREIELRESDVP